MVYCIYNWGLGDSGSGNVLWGSNTVHSSAILLTGMVWSAIVYLCLNSKLASPISHAGLITCWPTHWSLGLARETVRKDGHLGSARMGILIANPFNLTRSGL